LIGVLICAESLARGRSLAAGLEEDERITVVGVINRLPAGNGDSSPDVLVVEGTPFEDMLRVGCPVVLVSDEPFEGRLPRSVHAWLPVDIPNREVAAAVFAAAHDLVTLTEEQAQRWLPLTARADTAPGLEELTRRELQVLGMLADGLGNKEIARELKISSHTAKFHVAQILAKLGAATRTEAVATGIRRGLVPI
jgi:DNA-binding CsgD family transcriptional regulator